MADYLVYWQHYWDDKATGGYTFRPSGNWSTDSKRLYDTVESGDNLWVVVNGGSGRPNEWRLLERVKVLNRKLQRTKWGAYRIIGQKGKSPFFSLRAQPDFAAILALLQFASGRSIKVRGSRIGQALQTYGFRKLSEGDAALLERYAQALKAPTRQS